MMQFAKRAIGYGAVCALIGWWVFDNWLAGAGVGAALAVVELAALAALFRRR